VNVNYYSKYSQIGPSSRYRIFQYVDLFQAHGIKVQVQSLFDDSYFEFLRSAPSITQSLQKSLYVASRFEQRRKALRSAKKGLNVIEQQLFPYLPFFLESPFLPDRYVLEMDDAIYLTHPKKIPEVVRNAHAIVVGNEMLGVFARRFNSQVHMIPTVLDTDRFHPAEKQSAEKVTIGWSGLEYNFKYLRQLRQVFLYLVTTFPVEIVILSGSEPQDLGFPFRFEKWDPDCEQDQIAKFDIGIMPLEMDEWSRSKCGMKLLQYMALEIPSVATPAGVNAEILEEGKNGFPALTEEEWIERLSLLIQDAALRRNMGKMARKKVVEEYSVKAWFPRLLQLYSELSAA
jgi:glycosyltransferase involved in cell wall biosynthesis